MARKRKRQQLDEDSGFGPAPITLSEERSRLTPLDVQQKVFRLAFRGYNEQDVDQFLDQVTEDLASLHEENKRLREELELRGSPAAYDDAKRHAEETVRRAREEAARIKAEAERHVDLSAGTGVSPAPPAFLVRERDFLQELASLVQRHAETLKEEARRAREQQEAPEPEPARDTSSEADPEIKGAADPEPNPGPNSEPPASAPEGTTPMAAAPSSGSPEDEGLLREWSGAFEDEEPSERSWADEPQGPHWEEGGDDPMAEQGSGVPGYAGEGDPEKEPSLRELFWGEE